MERQDGRLNLIQAVSPALLKWLVDQMLTPEEKWEAAPVAAEMLVHFGRGQMRAQIELAGNTPLARLNVASAGDLQAISQETEIFKRMVPAKEIVERMLEVFAKSVATSGDAKDDFTFDSAVRKKVCAYAFFLGYMSWLSKQPLDMGAINSQFGVIKTHCPDPQANAGGGEFCSWGPF
jgi:hypothetical protein